MTIFPSFAKLNTHEFEKIWHSRNFVPAKLNTFKVIKHDLLFFQTCDPVNQTCYCPPETACPDCSGIDLRNGQGEHCFEKNLPEGKPAHLFACRQEIMFYRRI